MPPLRTPSRAPSRPTGLRTVCFNCEKKKLKCDLGRKAPCSNCGQTGVKCTAYNRKDHKESKPNKPKNETSLARELDAISNITTVKPGHYLGRDVSFDEPMETPKLAKETSLPSADLQLLKEQGAFTLPSNEIQHQLIATFMEYGHVWTPVIDPAWLTGTNPSFLLLQAIFVAASRMTTQPDEHGRISDFYRRAKLLFFFGLEKDPLICVASAILLHLYNPGPGSDMTDTSDFWLRTAESLAFQLGLHKEPENDRNAGLRRRLWWTIVLRDCIICASDGTPRTLTLTDSTVSPPSLDDFPEHDTQARIFPVHVSVALRLGDTVKRTLRGQAANGSALENSLFRWIKQDFPGICGPFPGCTMEARQVLIAYLANLIILDPSPSPDGDISARSLLASSFIVGLLRDFLHAGEVCRLGGIFTFYALTAGLILVPAGRVDGLRDMVNEEVIILRSCLNILSKQWISASDTLRTLHKIGQKSPKRLRITTPGQEVCPFFEGLDRQWCRLWAPVVENDFQQPVSSLVGSQASILKPYSNAQANAWDEPPLPIQYPLPMDIKTEKGSGYGASWVLKQPGN
ncbi:hypothetical protein BDV18DRAFT_69314 [Aspergillus unguis]